MKIISRVITGLLCALACTAHAEQTFDGHIAYHNDVAFHSIVLTAPGTLRVWTDSYISGANFDPIIAVWRNGQLLAQNDDNPNFSGDQTFYDAGLGLFNLGVGTYVVSVSAYGNFANGNNLGAGFNYDLQTPISLDTWCQPASHCNMGKHFSLHWSTQ